ncbi:MAG: TIGR02266 family protein [Sandaracinaceae bacterium]
MQNLVAEPPAETARNARRTAEVIVTAVAALREAVSDGGALSRAIERAARVSRGLLHDPTSVAFSRSVEATHHAVADVLAIGRAVRSGLIPRGQQGLEAFAAAQRVLYPIAKAHGVDAPPPLPAASIPMPDERRTSPRVEITVDISFGSDDNFYSGFSEDLSDGGLFVATYDLKPVGTVIELEFTLPDGHIVRTVAEVRWLRSPRDADSDMQPGMGMRFSKLAREDGEAIERFLAARAPLFYDDE